MTTTLTIVAVVVAILLAVLWRAFSAGRQTGENKSLKQKEQDNAKTLEDVRRASEAAAASDRATSDPERLRDDDGFKRR